MELGVQGMNAKATLAPARTLRLARRAEALGYSSWWAGEHVVLPSPRTAESPMDPTDPILDPLIHLTYVAAVTERIELGTAIVILPQRNPLVLAKQVASLDVLSAGRLLLGIGVGYLDTGFSCMKVISRRPVDADTARRYADLGVDRLVVYPLPLADPAEITTFLERHADLPR